MKRFAFLGALMAGALSMAGQRERRAINARAIIETIGESKTHPGWIDKKATGIIYEFNDGTSEIFQFPISDRERSRMLQLQLQVSKG
jgi:hypothetical protein